MHTLYSNCNETKLLRHTANYSYRIYSSKLLTPCNKRPLNFCYKIMFLLLCKEGVRIFGQKRPRLAYTHFSHCIFLIKKCQLSHYKEKTSEMFQCSSKLIIIVNKFKKHKITKVGGSRGSQLLHYCQLFSLVKKMSDLANKLLLLAKHLVLKIKKIALEHFICLI